MILRLRFNYSLGKFERPRDLIGSNENYIKKVKSLMEEVEDQIYEETKRRAIHIIIFSFLVIIGLIFIILEFTFVGIIFGFTNFLLLILRLLSLNPNSIEILKKVMKKKKWEKILEELNLDYKMSFGKFNGDPEYPKEIVNIIFLRNGEGEISNMNTVEELNNIGDVRVLESDLVSLMSYGSENIRHL